MDNPEKVECATCGAEFLPSAQQRWASVNRGVRYFCSSTCQRSKRREDAMAAIADGQKRCGRCRASRPLAAFHQSASAVAGYASSCRACCRDIRAAIRDQPGRKEAVKIRGVALRRRYATQDRPAIIRAAKRCPACGEQKAAREFYKQRTTADRLSGHCKACYKIRYQREKMAISDYYAFAIMGFPKGVRRADVPSELIAAKRAHLRLHRQIGSLK